MLTITDLEPDQGISGNLDPAALAAFNAAHPRELPSKPQYEGAQSKRRRVQTIMGDPASHADGIEYPEYRQDQEFDGLMANNSMYVNYTIPPGTHGNGVPNALYAPTMKAPRSCLEVSSEYYNGEQYYTVFDFCNGNGKYVLVKQTNSQFTSLYIRQLANGNSLPEYTTYTVSFYPGVVTAESDWKPRALRNYSRRWARDDFGPVH